MAYNSPYGLYHPVSAFTSTAGPTTGSASLAAASSTMSPDTAVEKIRRHPKYYLLGGDVHFLVENYLFRVHRYFFERESAFFRERLAIPAVPGQSPRGSSDTNPFPLEDVQAVDFGRFLWVFYNPKYSIYDAQIDDWTAILKLAFDWRFTEVKQLACRELEKFTIDPVQKIDLYQRYELDRKLLIPSYSALTLRAEPLSVKDGRQLGLETALLLAESREYARGKPSFSGIHSPSSANLDQEQMTDIIIKVFGIASGSGSAAPEESDDVFGLAPTPVSPSRLAASASVRPNGTPGHSRQPSQNITRTASPPPAETMPSIFQALAHPPPPPAEPEPKGNTPTADKETETEAALAAEGSSIENKDATTKKEPAATEQQTAGQAVTSPPSSILQRLISDSTSQEVPHPPLRVQLPPLEIPKTKVTMLQTPTESLGTPSKDQRRRWPAKRKQRNVPLAAAAEQEEQEKDADEQDVITTTIPVVDTPCNTMHDVTNANAGRRDESEQPKEETVEANPQSEENNDPSANQAQHDALSASVTNGVADNEAAQQATTPKVDGVDVQPGAVNGVNGAEGDVNPEATAGSGTKGVNGTGEGSEETKEVDGDGEPGENGTQANGQKQGGSGEGETEQPIQNGHVEFKGDTECAQVWS